MADDAMAGLISQAPADLLGRPACGKPVENGFAQGIVAIEPGAVPAPRLGLRLRIAGPIADLRAAVALQLARDCRRLAIQSCSDLPLRLPGFMKPGNRTSFLER
ncbi:hypothetical protein U1739_04585 [Sphingomonas sp. PB4P5]